jgi:hypothetical protein
MNNTNFNVIIAWFPKFTDINKIIIAHELLFTTYFILTWDSWMPACNGCPYRRKGDASQTSVVPKSTISEGRK